MIPKPRIFFDPNNGTEEWGYPLVFALSLEDIASIEGGPVTGMIVTIYMPDELEMDATLSFEEGLGYWKAMPIEGTTRYLDFVFDPAPRPAVPVVGGGSFPVRRIFCVGRNYAYHVKEMFGDPKSQPPVFFTKPADAVVASGAAIPYPTVTKDFHYEGELVVALKAGALNIAREKAEALIFGYAAGCDLTRRDIQAAAKKAGTPWDAAKGFDNSAAIAAIAPASKGLLEGARLTLSVNGETRQDEALSEMIWSIPEIIAALSKEFELKAGDLIYTGTPKGVGPLVPGDRVEVHIGKLPALTFSIGAPQ